MYTKLYYRMQVILLWLLPLLVYSQSLFGYFSPTIPSSTFSLGYLTSGMQFNVTVIYNYTSSNLIILNIAEGGASQKNVEMYGSPSTSIFNVKNSSYYTVQLSTISVKQTVPYTLLLTASNNGTITFEQ